MTKFLTASATALAVAFAAAFAVALATQPAHANDGAGRQMAVHHADLDLSTANGMKELDRRIERAARKVCTVSGGGSPLSRVDSNCFIAAKNSTRTQVASLSQRYAARD